MRRKTHSPTVSARFSSARVQGVPPLKSLPNSVFQKVQSAIISLMRLLNLVLPIVLMPPASLLPEAGSKFDPIADCSREFVTKLPANRWRKAPLGLGIESLPEGRN